uniref:Uncharacterized protein n=1 Tax=Picea glauca TaxID=3330 RepID=A0A117NIC1_PICGL|nr:hypothetical protein ABT39_MTgene6235 [Picea glauca]KUM48750.1 hypothetical protein ABT39_MTgene4086 [Picea glauca]KUM49716.1 hypothetical protein ABT39_MTgene2943 [Picea glauca]
MLLCRITRTHLTLLSLLLQIIAIRLCRLLTLLLRMRSLRRSIVLLSHTVIDVAIALLL